jgi:hypothetical protein
MLLCCQYMLLASTPQLFGSQRCILLPYRLLLLLSLCCCCWLLLQLLVKWWSDYPAELLERRVVAPMQAYLTKELMATKKLTIGVMNAIKVRQQQQHAVLAEPTA